MAGNGGDDSATMSSALITSPPRLEGAVRSVAAVAGSSTWHDPQGNDQKTRLPSPTNQRSVQSSFQENLSGIGKDGLFLRVASTSKDGAELAWDAPEGATEFRIEVQNAGSGEQGFIVADAVKSDSGAWVFGLETGLLHTFRVFASSQGGQQQEGSHPAQLISVVSTCKATPLPPPSPKLVRISASSALVQWNPVEGANMYRVCVRRCDSSDDEPFVASNGLADTCFHIGADLFDAVSRVAGRGDVGHHRVDVTVQAGWNGCYESEGGTCVASRLGPPELERVEFGATSARLAWRTVSGADNYEVLLLEGGDANADSESQRAERHFQRLCMTHRPKIEINDLVPGQERTFRVLATVAGVSECLGCSVSIVPLPPTALVNAIPESPHSLGVEWAPVEGAKEYLIRWSQRRQNGERGGGEFRISGCKTTLRGLETGRQVELRVWAGALGRFERVGTRAVGIPLPAPWHVQMTDSVEGALSLAWKAHPAADVFRVEQAELSAPSGDATRGGDVYPTNSDELVWTLADVGAWELQPRPGGGNIANSRNTTTVEAEIEGISAGAVVQGLKIGQLYMFRVFAGIGTLDVFEPQGGSAVGCSLARVAGLRVCRVGRDFVEIVWGGVHTAGFYEIRFSPVAEQCSAYEDGVQTGESQGVLRVEPTRALIEKLDTGKMMSISVHAGFAGVCGDVGTSINVVALAPPSALTVVSLGETTCAVEWDDTPGATHYHVSWMPLEDANTADTGGEIEVTRTHAQVVGLESGVRYRIRVQAVREGAPPEVTGVALSVTPIAAPLEARFVSLGRDIGRMEWRSVRGAEEYLLEWQASGGQELEDDPLFWPALGLGGRGGREEENGNDDGWVRGESFALASVPANRARCVRVRSGAGGVFETRGVSARLPLVSVTGLKAGFVTGDSVALGWRAVPGAASYVVEVRREEPECGGTEIGRVGEDDGAACWAAVGATDGTEYLVTGLSSGTLWRFRVRGRASDGVTDDELFSSTTAAATIAPLERAVANASPSVGLLGCCNIACLGHGFVLLRWTAAPAATHYRVYRQSGDGPVEWELVYEEPVWLLDEEEERRGSMGGQCVVHVDLATKSSSEADFGEEGGSGLAAEPIDSRGRLRICGGAQGVFEARGLVIAVPSWEPSNVVNNLTASCVTESTAKLTWSGQQGHGDTYIVTVSTWERDRWGDESAVRSNIEDTHLEVDG